MSSSSGVGSGSNGLPTVQEHTRECLDEMKNMQGELANIIILMGRTGVGKSALLEYITNASGHSKQSDNPVTLKFQIEHVEIDGKKYYIMDTPGFDTDREQEVFLEITRGIKAARPYAKIIGVMLVTRIDTIRAEEVDKKLIDFVYKFCGRGYIPQVTVVTTFWNVSEDEERVEFEGKLQDRLQRWRRTLGQDLRQYQHGRRYQNGSDTGECLRWRGDCDDIKIYAKMMISRHYSNIHPQDPRIVQELLANTPLERTAAGQFLGLIPTHGSSSTPSSSTSTSSSEQPGPSSPQSRSSRTTPDEAPRPSSTNRAPGPEADNQNQNQCQNQDGQPPQQESPISNFFKGIFRDFIVPEGIRALRGALTGRGGFPGWLDPLSSVDHFIARGMPTDLGYRTTWARQHGIWAEPGSAAFGDAVRRAIMRESPL